MRALRTSTRALMTGVAVAAVVVGTAGAAPSNEIEIPIKGQAFTGGAQPKGAPGVLTIHGVRRVDNATIVYWSLGRPPGNQGGVLTQLLGASTSAFDNRLVAPKQGDVGLIDGVGQRVFRPLAPPSSGNPCVCSPVQDLLHLEPGQAVMLWSGVSPLPPEVTTVDVSVGEQVIPGVPVEDGPLEPLAEDQDNPILVGYGWPEIPADLLANAKPQQPAFHPLIARVSNLEGSVTTSKGSVSLASDVLFTKDSATLSPKAQAVISTAAAEVTRGSSTVLKVTGHADSDASDAYNLTLSKARAAAVAGALRRALGPGYTVTADGKGEAEPIASNRTAAGKAKNRRVAITWGGK